VANGIHRVKKNPSSRGFAQKPLPAISKR